MIRLASSSDRSATFLSTTARYQSRYPESRSRSAAWPPRADDESATDEAYAEGHASHLREFLPESRELHAKGL